MKITMATPRHSNQSVKYHRVGVPMPAADKKVKGMVGKALCFMHETDKVKAERKSSQTRNTVDRKDGKENSRTGTKSKVKESSRRTKGDHKRVSDEGDSSRVQPNIQLVVSSSV